MNLLYEPDKHYKATCKISGAEIEHTHWRKSLDGKMVSLLNVEFRLHEGGRSLVSSIDLWDVQPNELRSLAETMIEAAEALEQHQQQIEGGATC